MRHVHDFRIYTKVNTSFSKLYIHMVAVKLGLKTLILLRHGVGRPCIRRIITGVGRRYAYRFAAPENVPFAVRRCKTSCSSVQFWTLRNGRPPSGAFCDTFWPHVPLYGGRRTYCLKTCPTTVIQQLSIYVAVLVVYGVVSDERE